MEILFSPENWQTTDWVLAITLLVLVVWMLQMLFVYWRRRQTNLTPVDVPSKNNDAQPDFLHIDKKARNEALKRGDRFAAKIVREQRSVEQRVSKWASLCLGSVSIILTVISIIILIAR